MNRIIFYCNDETKIFFSALTNNPFLEALKTAQNCKDIVGYRVIQNESNIIDKNIILETIRYYNRGK